MIAGRFSRLSMWPRSLFGRLTLILFCGLVVAHALSFGLVIAERTQSSLGTMINYLSKDIASAVAILEQLPQSERQVWLGKLERNNYRYLLGATSEGRAVRTGLSARIATSIRAALGPQYPVRTTEAEEGNSILMHLQLRDGTPLVVELMLAITPISPWVVFVLTAQLALLILFSWLAVRTVTRPLDQLAQAADTLRTNLKGDHLPEDGPLEVARAATAFNAMQRKIADHLAERMQLLAAISHDLQTPIMRMRLRAELLDDAVLREKLYGDLDAMQMLVQEGLTYARDGQGITEPARRADLNALLDSLVCDYTDVGKPVRLTGRYDRPLLTRAHSLRRIVSNLLDNAFKFGGDPEILVAAEAADHVSITVRDCGPGIPPNELETVLQPFYRLENSRNRETGGTGLGLAIAQQLTLALGGTLTLANRKSGGLEAHLSIPHLKADK
ncbi:MAG: HAMP domain-containing protein [Candidatus Obscuribacterales bacterium]|nr:HAMP domain-containing protein [Steroidobacteraceae bacterium]